MKIENGLDNPSPIVYNQIAKLNDTSANTEKYSRGRRGAPAKGVGWATAARVQIPLSPPKNPRSQERGFFIQTRRVWHVINPRNADCM